MTAGDLPDHAVPIAPGERFTFLCHSRIDCFTDCCRALELALTPYDVLRLRRATGLNSAELHRRYLIEEQDPDEGLPRFYLTMVDDGRSSCVFVGARGCSIYAHRPGACRTYPLGRGTVRKGSQVDEHFVLLREPHCRGFEETAGQSIGEFITSQELEPYQHFNDLLTAITQHNRMRRGLRPGEAQLRLYRLALYDLDSFRAALLEGQVQPLLAVPDSVYESDEALLEFGLKVVDKVLFDS